MSEAEGLQKIVIAQEKEVRTLRKLLSKARVAQVDYHVEDGELHIILTSIGVDEYYFVEQCKPELEAIATALCDAKMKTGPIQDSVTGEEMLGAVNP